MNKQPRRALPGWLTLAALLSLIGGGQLFADQPAAPPDPPAPSTAVGRIAPENMPGPLKDVGFDQHLGGQLPLDAWFTDAEGRRLQLGEVIGQRPVVLAFVYYERPMLCSLVMNGVAKSLDVLPFEVGREFDVVAISIDPGETPEMARQARAAAVERYGRPEIEANWHFLVGDQDSVSRTSEVAGFRFVYLPDEDEYAHAAGILIATPEGKVAQYFYGIEYSPKSIRLALVDAAEEKRGSLIDQVLLYCFQYDPQLGKYTMVAMRVLRVAGAAFALFMASFLWLMWRRERSETPSAIAR